MTVGEVSPQYGITEILLPDTHLLVPAILYIAIETSAEGKMRNRLQLSLYAEERPSLDLRL